MLVLYTFQDSNGRPFPDNLKKRIFDVDFPATVTIGEIKERLGLWHSLDPSTLTMYSTDFNSAEERALYRSGRNVKFPLALIVYVNEGSKRDANPKINSSKLPISRILQYLLNL
jgi:hypothetical protein